MRNRLFLVALGATLPAASAAAQAGGGPSGAYPDIRNSDDLGVHDSATQPSPRDLMMKRIMEDNLDRAAKAQRDKLGYARPAKADEIVAGAGVNDKSGFAIATIETIDKDGIVLNNGHGKVKIPADAFGHNKAGLLLDMPKAQFDQLVAKANAG